MMVHTDVSSCECENCFTFDCSLNYIHDTCYALLVCVSVVSGHTPQQGCRTWNEGVCVCVVNGAELLQSVKADCNGVIWNAIGKG